MNELSKMSKMMLLPRETVYRSVELAFDSNLECILMLMVESVKATFKEHGFNYATLTLDIRNPSKEKMFK